MKKRQWMKVTAVFAAGMLMLSACGKSDPTGNVQDSTGSGMGVSEGISGATGEAEKMTVPETEQLQETAKPEAAAPMPKLPQETAEPEAATPTPNLPQETAQPQAPTPKAEYWGDNFKAYGARRIQNMLSALEGRL